MKAGQDQTSALDPAPISAAPSPVETLLPELAADISKVVDQGVEFYVASNGAVLPDLHLRPYGTSLNCLDFTRTPRQEWSTEEFLDLFNVMNSVAFGARGIPMPRWVMIDLALLPSAAVIATLSQDSFETMLRTVELEEVTRTRMTAVLRAAQQNSYTGPIPVGGYCASPSATVGRWVGWSLWSVIPRMGLALAAKALGLAVYRAQRLDGVTQYDNVALKVHTRFGRLRIIAATVPLHTAPGSFIYENDLTSNPTDLILEPTFYLDPADYDRQKAMQASIESGATQYFIIPPGRHTVNGAVTVPIIATSPSSAGPILAP